MWSSRPPGMPLPLAEVSEITMSPSSKWSSLSPRDVAPAGSSLTLTPDPSGRFPEPRRVRRERTNLSRSGATTRTDPPVVCRRRGPWVRPRSLAPAVVLPRVAEVGGVALGAGLLRRVVERAVAAGLVERAVPRLVHGVAAVEVAALGVVALTLRDGPVAAVVVTGHGGAVDGGAVDVGVRHAGARLVGAAHLWLPRRGASRRTATVRHVPGPPARQPGASPAPRGRERREAGSRAGAGLTARGGRRSGVGLLRLRVAGLDRGLVSGLLSGLGLVVLGAGDGLVEVDDVAGAVPAGDLL